MTVPASDVVEALEASVLEGPEDGLGVHVVSDSDSKATRPIRLERSTRAGPLYHAQRVHVGESSAPLNNVIPLWYLGQSMSSIDRIEKLIALSGSTNEHEARSAAYLACKLIREGGYRVVAKAADPWDEAFTASAWTAYTTRAEPQARRRPAPDTRPRRRVPCEIGRARRSGLCAVCTEPFEEGSDVAFPMLASDANLGVVHADCRTRWTVPIDP